MKICAPLLQASIKPLLPLHSLVKALPLVFKTLQPISLEKYHSSRKGPLVCNALFKIISPSSAEDPGNSMTSKTVTPKVNNRWALQWQQQQ
jgi:hypothetical protein